MCDQPYLNNPGPKTPVAGLKAAAHVARGLLAELKLVETDAQSVHDTGLEEVARLTEAMAEVEASVERYIAGVRD